jgi:hypothetical protein
MQRGFCHGLLGLLVAVAVHLALSFPVAHAQGTDALDGAIIQSAEVSGLAVDQLSPDLRDDIDALVGAPLHRERVDVLATRIEAEHPEFVVAVRPIALPDGESRVIFLVARISDDRDLVSNINARYTVESVEISGVPDTDVSRALREDLQGLVGERLDPDEAERLDDRLEAELPGRDVRRRIARGSRSGQIHVVFEVGEARGAAWIDFAPSRSMWVYHSELAWSGTLDLPMGTRNHRLTVGLVVDDKEELIEEYTGYRVRLESRKVVTERVGLSLEFADLRPSWQRSTLSALGTNPGIGEIYQNRRTVEPAVTFAFSPQLRVRGGASVTELESLFQPQDLQIAGTVVASIGFDQTWNRELGSTHDVHASYEVRTSTTALDSDLDYTRQLGEARYQFQSGRNLVMARVSFGRIGGAAPLFERFSLGNASTLRGWSKFDVAPAGGNRMVYQSLEYRHRQLAFFFDAGSVWDQGTDAQVRLSTGVGFHSDNFFLTVGLPLNADGVDAQFMTGVSW